MTILLLLSSTSSLAKTDQGLDDELSQRCLGTFEFVKTKDLAAFMAQMPPQHSKGQEKRLEKILERAHERRFGKGKWNSIDVTGISYEEASKAKQERFGALKLAKISMYIDGVSYKAHVRCEYINTPEGWFLSSLP